MAKFSNKVMGKEIGSAKVYAEPHTMSGGAVTAENAIPRKKGAAIMDELNIGVAGISKGNTPGTKTDGIIMRGHGAATKGIKSRGPMA